MQPTCALCDDTTRHMGSAVQRQHSDLCSPNTISEVSTFAPSYWEVIVTGLSRWSFLSGLVLLYPAWINKGWISRLQPKDVHDKASIQRLRDFLKHNLYFRAKLRKNTVVLPILQMKKGIYCIYQWWLLIWRGPGYKEQLLKQTGRQEFNFQFWSHWSLHLNELLIPLNLDFFIWKWDYGKRWNKIVIKVSIYSQGQRWN